jgi:hypothetical protein
VRKEVPIVICAAAALIYVLSTFINPTTSPFLGKLKGDLDTWYLLVYAVAFAVGLINLAQIHLRKVTQQRQDWQFSIVLLLFMGATLLFGIFTTGKGVYTDFLYQYFFVNPRATMYSILVFYISSAAYRAFRIKTFEASILLVAAVIMMLGQAPIGEVIWSQIPKMSAWILNYPNAAGMRGITIAATLGGVATALRIVLGIERGHLGGGGE